MKLTRLLGVETPIVLGPFGGMSSVELTAAVSEAGGLGSFGLYGLGPDRIHEVARELRERTAKPFAATGSASTRDRPEERGAR